MADHNVSNGDDLVDPLSPLMTPEQAAEQLGIPHRRLYAWKSEGKGPKFVQIGRSIRYRQSDLDDYIEANVVDPADA